MEIISKVISKVDEPTEWGAGMVVVAKANGKVPICVDLTKLNESILREYHPLPRVDYSLAQLAGATIFSKLDANSGFWQIGLSPESAKLTIFIILFGRFCSAYRLESVQPLNTSRNESRKFWKEPMVLFVRWTISLNTANQWKNTISI